MKNHAQGPRASAAASSTGGTKKKDSPARQANPIRCNHHKKHIHSYSLPVSQDQIKGADFSKYIMRTLKSQRSKQHTNPGSGNGPLSITTRRVKTLKNRILKETAFPNTFKISCERKILTLYFLQINTIGILMKKYLLLFIILLLSLGSTFAETEGEDDHLEIPPNEVFENDVLHYTSFYPNPYSELNHLQLIPLPESAIGTPPLFGQSCQQPGLLFLNQDHNQLYFCHKALFSQANEFSWQNPPGIWQQEGHTIFLSPLEDQNNTFIGAGLPGALSVQRLTLAYDGSILASGTFNSNHPLGSFNILETSGTGTRMIWYPERAAVRIGGIQQNRVDLSPGNASDYTPNSDGPDPFLPDWNDSHIGNYSVAFGINNEARAPHSGILGGEYALIESGADYSVILNSPLNTAIRGNSAYSTSAGGSIADSQYAFAGGQLYYTNQTGTYHNTTLIDHSDYATVLNSGTIIESPYSFIGSALPNPDDSCNPADDVSVDELDDDFGAVIASDSCSSGHASTHAAILCAYALINCSPHGLIGSGSQHLMHESPDAVLLSGKQNTIQYGEGSVILGGENNMAGGDTVTLEGHGTPSVIPGSYQFLGGGKNNRVHTGYSVIAGGEGNHAGSLKSDGVHATHAVIAGGLNNNAYGLFSFIGGGSANQTGTSDPLSHSGSYAVILGGSGNTVSGDYSLIGSGKNNRIDADYSAVEGGQNNTLAQGSDYSWLFGNNTTVAAPRSWTFAFNETIPSGSDTFIISGTDMRVGIQTMDPQAELDVNGDAAASTIIIASGAAVPGGGTDLKLYRSPGTHYNQIGHQDLAEVFSASEPVSPGDVVVLDRSSDTIRITKSRTAYDPLLVGVVSTAPAMVFRDGTILSDFSYTQNSTLNPPVALSGQVPCKVSLENGDIHYGDLLTPSSTPGHAMKATDRDRALGAVIGKALEPLTKASAKGARTGMISILVALQ